jgi:hypothetical protein
LIRAPSSAILNEPTLSRRRSDVSLGQFALGSVPVFGGAMLAIAAGQFRGPDYRGLIKEDMDLLDRLPEDATVQRAELQRTIESRIDDLVYASDRGRALRTAALSYRGNWRDIVLLLCVLLFMVIWWDVDHSRSNWMPMFILLIVLSVVATIYTLRGMFRSVLVLIHLRRDDRQHQSPAAEAPK